MGRTQTLKDRIEVGQLRVWGGNAGWQDCGKTFVVLKLKRVDGVEILQEGSIVEVRGMFISMFSELIGD